VTWQLRETFCDRLEDAQPPDGEGWEPLNASLDMVAQSAGEGRREMYRIIWRREMP
jgi:hypothetical protein